MLRRRNEAHGVEIKPGGTNSSNTLHLVRRLVRLGYSVTRQTGSHLRLTITAPNEHHITIPRHDALRVGTLASILDDVAAHFELTRDELMARLFD